MKDKQTQLLLKLAKRLKAEKKSKEAIMNSFVSAGILTHSGEFTKPYHNLRTVVIAREVKCTIVKLI